VEYFPSDRWPELEEFRPQVLAGSTGELQKLAQCVQSRAFDLSSVDHAIFAITVCGEEALSDRTRVVLWQAFGVPVYELLVSANGTLLGSECEAHDGWHVEPNVRFAIIDGKIAYVASGRTGEPTGLAGRLESGRCACGRLGVRILDVKPVIAQAKRKLAAIA
jgi:phenylacetate-coenzyme A ligase PaaK-like adenylate-forming protein